MTATHVPAPPPDAAEPRLWNRNFTLLWQGQLVSQLGNQAFAIAMMYWLMETTGSASLMGSIMMASMLPGVLLGPIGGTFADRHSRVRIIVGSDLVRGLVTLGLFLAIWLRPEAHGLVVGMLFATAIVGGITNAVFMPAISAAIPDIVPPKRLAAANSLNQFSTQGVTFVGQAIGGVLYRVLGAPMLFLIDGISYLLSALSEAFIRLPGRTPGGVGLAVGAEEPGAVAAAEGDAVAAAGGDAMAAGGDADAALGAGADAGVAPGAGAGAGAPGAGARAGIGHGRAASSPPTFRAAFASYRDDTLEGIRYVWTRVGMRSFLLLAASVNFLVMPVVVLLPFYVSMQLAEGPAWYGFLLATIGVGSVIGYLIAGAVPISASRRPAVVIGGFVLIGAAIGALGQATQPGLALVSFAAVGLGSGLINIFVLTLLQQATPPEMRGRVMSLVITLSLGAAPIGMGLGGVVGDLTDKNTPLIFGVCGGLMLVATAVVAARRPLREFLATEV